MNSIAEIADRYTILLLKQSAGLDVKDELQKLKNCLGIIKPDALQAINKTMWDLENLITDEKDLAKIGAYCLALRFMNRKRVEEKNELARMAGDTYIEEKNY